MTRLLTVRFHALVLSGLVASPLAAQMGGSPAETPEEAQPVSTYEDVLFVQESLPYVPESNTIATKLPLPLQETPASVSVVSERLMTEQGDTVLGEALRNSSGVNVQTQSGVADFFVVRGFDSTANGLVLVDGAAEPEISFYQLYNVERAEILKGPGGFLYGANPLAATVNMVRKQPEPGRFLDLRTSGGSFGERSGSFDWNAGGNGPVSFRLDGLWQASDGYRDDKPSKVRAINPGLTWRPNDRTSLNLNVEYLDTSFSPDSGLPLVPGLSGQRVADVPRTRSYQSPYDRSDQETRRAQIDYQTEISDRLTLRDKTYYRRLDWLSDGTIFNGIIPGGGLFPDQIIRTLVLLDDTQEFVGNQLEAVYSASAGSVSHRLLTGLELGRFDDRFTLGFGLLPTIGIDQPVELASGPVQRIPNQAADASSRVIAPYVVDQIGLSDRLQVVAGARFDAIGYKDTVSSTSRDFSKLSPMLGVVYSPVPALSLYANTGQAFAPPSSRVVGKREPEESRQTELGLKANLWQGKLQTTLALYQLERRHIAIPDLTGFIEQTGTQRSRGIELEVAAEPLPRLRTVFSYAYTDAELTHFTEVVMTSLNPPAFNTFDRSGNVPAFAPRHIANLWLSRRFDHGIGAAVGGRYLSKQLIAEDNAFAIDSTATLDAALFYERNAWRLSLNFENLTNEQYFTRGFGATSVIPAPGRTVHVGIAYRLGGR
ncbi:MAG TPA: TonB-dependent receptor [Thermoanaerobaculia bacterium]|jgi:TonB-dependent siderophore receptor